jgi:hypothetical protein
MVSRTIKTSRRRRAASALIASSSLFLSSLTIPLFADSQVRIVRLSEVDGNVQFDNPAGQQYEKAFLNLPITQGVKLRSQSDGRAEVEFEDGSTLRVVPDTVVEFPQLALLDSGGKASTIHVKQGTAYVNFAGAKDEQLTVTFGQEKLVLTHATHLRLEVTQSDAAVAVFKGEVEVQGPSGAVNVGRKQTATFDTAGGGRHELAKNLEEDPYDAWDKSQDQYHERYTAANYSTYSPYAYGTADLSYYGSFFNAPGYGSVWQPYFASAGWDPFMNGAWAFGPGTGYGWVSSYPWGWTPYHYGTWMFVPSYGWAWQAGSTWTGFNAMPRVLNAPANFVAPQIPLTTRATVLVNRAPVQAPSGKSVSKLVIRANSAGLGIPRGGIENLAKVSETVAERGSVAAKVRTVAVQPEDLRAVGQGKSAPAGSSLEELNANRTPVSSPVSTAPAGHSGQSVRH